MLCFPALLVNGKKPPQNLMTTPLSKPDAQEPLPSCSALLIGGCIQVGNESGATQLSASALLGWRLSRTPRKSKSISGGCGGLTYSYCHTIPFPGLLGHSHPFALLDRPRRFLSSSLSISPPLRKHPSIITCRRRIAFSSYLRLLSGFYFCLVLY